MFTSPAVRRFRFERGAATLRMLLLSVAVLFGAAGLALHVIAEFREGKGLDYYVHGSGGLFNPVGALVTLGVLPMVVCVAIALRWWSNRRRAQ